MEIAFQTKRLRDICESDEKLKRQFGDRVAEGIKARLADLRAASTIRDILIGAPQQVVYDEMVAMRLDLEDGHFVIFCSNHFRTPLGAESSIDWSAVSRIKILAIEAINAQGS